MAIADNFEDIIEKYPGAMPLKEGGQKSVWLIDHLKYGRSVLKVGNYSHPEALERIQREVNTLRKIDSKYYPKNYDFIILDGNRFVIIEEYVDCTPLSDCLSSYTDPKLALLLIKEIVTGLVILWNMNIVHRDIKPDNILITKSGCPKIIDLGIARLLDEESLTHTLAKMGPNTPIYAAPEQLENRKSAIGIRTDQFNLGIVLMQLLLGGAHPFDPHLIKSGSSIVENIINDKWYSKWLDDNDLLSIKPLISQLLGHEPFMRFRSPQKLIDAIDICLEGGFHGD